MPRIIQDDAHRQFIAIVVGESSDNMYEAAAIGSVLMNRLRIVGASVTGNFINAIGLGNAEVQYQSMTGPIYPDNNNTYWLFKIFSYNIL